MSELSAPPPPAPSSVPRPFLRGVPLADVPAAIEQWADDLARTLETEFGSLLARYLPTGQGAMQGTLTLQADPQAALEAATKQYVDALAAAGSAAAAAALAVLAADVTTLQGDVSALQGDVTTLQGDVSSLQTLVGQAAPAGTIGAFAMNSAPGGWFKANGALVSRTTYAALFAAIGTTFGAGDGSTTFGLPDLRGEFIRGWDDGRGIDSGRVFGSLQLDQLQNITGVLANMWGFGGAGTSGALSSTVSGSSNQPGTGGGGSRDVAFNASGSTGARTGTETRPRSLALLLCIKY
jgi:microcystin-dependent protein